MSKVKANCVARWFGIEDASNLNDKEYSEMEVKQHIDRAQEPWCSFRIKVDGKVIRIMSGAHDLPIGENEFPTEGIVKVSNKRVVNFVPLTAQPTK